MWHFHSKILDSESNTVRQKSHQNETFATVAFFGLVTTSIQDFLNVQLDCIIHSERRRPAQASSWPHEPIVQCSDASSLRDCLVTYSRIPSSYAFNEGYWQNVRDSLQVPNLLRREVYA
jgi:hypothetical protein